MPIHLTISPSPHAHFLRTHLKKILRTLNIQSATWSITIIRDKEMRQLHKKTLNLNTTTDVLTFDLRDPPPANQKSKIKNQKSQEGSPLELDTAICVDEARRRAQQFRHPIQHELLLYALHSLLHVQGYDDTTAKQAAQMHTREDALLLAIGLGPVYTKRKTQNRKSKIKNRKSPRSTL